MGGAETFSTTSWTRCNPNQFHYPSIQGQPVNAIPPIIRSQSEELPGAIAVDESTNIVR